jgi:hypothetical protein
MLSKLTALGVEFNQTGRELALLRFNGAPSSRCAVRA